MGTSNGRRRKISSLILLLLSLPIFSLAYRPGDLVPMSRMGQYHSSRTLWQDMIGRHCPIFAVNREALVPIPKPTGYTGADPYKISFQIGREKFLIPWLLVVNRKSPEVPMIDVHLRYSGSDLHGVTAKVLDMPHHCHLFDEGWNHLIGGRRNVVDGNDSHGIIVYSNYLLNEHIENHPDVGKQFWDPQHWPKHILVRYTWEEKSEIDVTSGFYVLFGSGLMLSFILSIYILQSSRDKLARFVRETVAESSMPGGGVAKVE